MNHYMQHNPAPKMPKREKEALLEVLRELLSDAEMDDASFGMGDEKLTDYIKETTRLYRKTYLIAPLTNLIDRYK